MAAQNFHRYGIVGMAVGAPAIFMNNGWYAMVLCALQGVRIRLVADDASDDSVDLASSYAVNQRLQIGAVA
jgi:hypothetical protein